MTNTTIGTGKIERNPILESRVVFAGRVAGGVLPAPAAGAVDGGFDACWSWAI